MFLLRFPKEEIIPLDACVHFYECESCKKIVKPKEGGSQCVLLIWNSEMSFEANIPMN